MSSAASHSPDDEVSVPVSTWRALVLAEVRQLTIDLTLAETEAEAEAAAAAPESATRRAKQRSAACGSLKLAKEVAETRPPWWSPTRFTRWVTGSDVETAWRAVHAAEQLVLSQRTDPELRARLAEIRASLTVTLATDGRLPRYLDVLDRIAATTTPRVPTPPPASSAPTTVTIHVTALTVQHQATAPTATSSTSAAAGPDPVLGAAGIAPTGRPTVSEDDREALLVMKRSLDAVSDTAFANVRNYRNWLLAISAVLTVALVTIAVAHLLWPGFLAPCPASPAACEPDRSALLQLEAAGSLGGLLTALFALLRLPVFSGPVALPLWQALVRLPAGAAAGVTGALLVQAQVIAPLGGGDPRTLVGVAVLLGAAPEILLRAFDAKVATTTDAARTKSDPLAIVPAQSTNTAA